MSEPSAAPSTVGNEVGPQCPPLFSRPTPHAPRPTLGGILPLTNGRFVKEQTGPDLDEHSPLFHYVTEPGDSFGQINPFSPLADARPLTIRSRPETLNASGSRRLPDGHQPQCPFSH